MVIPDQPTALWTLYKDGREMACLARLVPYGVEIDIAYDGATVSTRAFGSGDEALTWAADRRRDRESNGWNERLDG